MVDRRLVTGIKGDIKRGYSLAEIKSKYLARYSDVDIDEAILAAKGIEVSKPIGRSTLYDKDNSKKILGPFIMSILIIGLIIGVYYYLVFIEKCDENQYMAGGICKDYTCTINEECDDGNSNTIDVCLNPSTERAKCIYENVKTGQTIQTPTCGECGYLDNGVCRNYVCCSDLDCNDDNENTGDTCLAPKTKNAVCQYIPGETEEPVETECECGYLTSEGCFPYVCCSDSDCDDDNIDTFDTCFDPSSEYSACLNEYPFEDNGEDNYTENFSE